MSSCNAHVHACVALYIPPPNSDPTSQSLPSDDTPLSRSSNPDSPLLRSDSPIMVSHPILIAPPQPLTATSSQPSYFYVDTDDNPSPSTPRTTPRTSHHILNHLLPTPVRSYSDRRLAMWLCMGIAPFIVFGKCL